LKKGYWLYQNQIFDVPLTHIRFLIENNKLFGIERDFIEQIYKYYNEEIPVEGKAQRVLMRKAFINGFIRVRERENYFVIELDEVNKERLKVINNFLNFVLKEEIISKNDTVYIYDKYSKIHIFRVSELTK
jgi:hypothetical protein